jgi:ABC-2 type transport system ATP-binding protein
MSIIQIQDLSKVYRIVEKAPGIAGSFKALFRPRYKDILAVDRISFAIEPGELVGYIGVNGAGKSTTIKMLTGILLPSGGAVRVLGRDPYQQRVANARDIGVVFGQRSQLWWDLPLIESLNFIQRIYEIPPASFKRRLDEFAETLELKALFGMPVRSLSLGQKMRAELAATLIHDPQVVYLDEPTIGLDLIVKERIREFIKEQNRQRNVTVILTTHDLGDIEEICQRVIMIDAGRIIYDGPLSLIKDRFGKFREITLEAANPIRPFAVPPGSEIVNQEAQRITLRFDRTATTASQVAAAIMSQLDVADFSLAEPDLASIVKQIYSGALHAQ